jgi:ribosomal protein S18 acetylase RimI-like enzyme
MDNLVIGEHNCRIRPVRRTDLLRIFEIEKRVFGEDKFDIILLRDLLKQSILFIILEDAISEEILGFCIAMQIDPQDAPSENSAPVQLASMAHIVNIAIDVPYQGHGLGKMLLQHSLNEIRNQGYYKVQLEVNTANQRAISLYTKFGFHQGEFLLNYYRSCANAYRMDLDLQNN